jgi:DNA helicase-2/ATP-dependent DNA helicase PcrA
MTQLNRAQRDAVEHGDGPLLILAGAGSGKTRVITHRIASLIAKGVDPQAIVAVSFTNKAAREMAERMVPLVGSRKAGKIRMSTFHSFGLALLKEESRAAGIGGKFVIFDQADSLGVVKEILRGLIRGGQARRLDPMAVLARISNWKSAMVATDAVAESEFEYDAIARDVYPEYEDRLRAMRALDFDDLVCRPVTLLRDDEAIRAKWQKRIEHLLVDEFQDTSGVQLELVKRLANDRRNVCVVGDDDQSIYSWRGANVGNILEFEKHFPGANVVKLETNYRSRAPILEVANAVISNSDSRRHAKTLRAARDGGDAVRTVACETPRGEAEFVAAEIGQLRKENTPLEQVAVLYRSNQQARLIEEELTAHGIPHRVFGGQQFFDRKEVKDTAAYLRFVVNPWDEISLRRVINYPTRGVGTRSVERIAEYAANHRMPFVKAFERAHELPSIPDGARAAIGNLQKLFADARARMDSTGRLHEAASALVETINIRSALDDSAEGGAQGELRYQNVLRLLEWLARYERDTPRTKKSLQDFLQRVTLNGDSKDKEVEGPGVTLCTLHAAKGLEFGVVFLIGCIEGQLPHTRTTDPKASEAVAGDLDERMLRGKTVEVTPSRYMDELPAEHVQEYERPPDEELSHDELNSLVRDLLKKHTGGDGAAPDVGAG